MTHSVQCTDPSVFVLGFAVLLVLGAYAVTDTNEQKSDSISG